MAQVNTHHEEQVTKYMKFTRTQREESLREIDGSFDDFKESRLQDSTYTVNEVQKLFSDLAAIVKSSVQTDLQNMSNAMVLLLRQLFSQAEKQYVSLDVDAGSLEDKLLLDQVAKAEEATSGKPALGAPKPQLASLRVDAGKALEAGQMKEDMKQMRERMQRVQAQAAVAVKEKASLTHELERLKAELETTKSSESDKEQKLKLASAQLATLLSKTASLESEMSSLSKSSKASGPKSADSASKEEGDRLAYIQNLRKELNETKAQLDSVTKDHNVKLNESKQFQQLRKMLETKNQSIKSLREELKKFRPEADIPVTED
eukprot:CAMPEP_0184656472 /NCGR_PEP_ID=MMETSP0308-20130426/16532_1 /TAXON_ID=38269 /ORGANISM="Gloeochaete witrockiana, Strain SAG 46.84" /LENGTH=317 /DNA_ID=CAMNT_0027093621 /DNA_START=9 /DNA_END=962 /DNA_ORIENTATION=-